MAVVAQVRRDEREARRARERREVVRQPVLALQGSRGQYLADGVVLTSFVPMRARMLKGCDIYINGAPCPRFDWWMKSLEQ